MLVSTSYWEGPITIAGSHQGQGYMELTGYR
jgi:predicted secreted hydrolase